MAYRYRYTRWDGTQRVVELDDDALMDEMAEDLTTHGDFERALRNLYQRGMQRQDGGGAEGLRHLRDQLQKRRQGQLDHYNLDNVFKDIEERLQRIIQKEREGIDDRIQEARGDASRDDNLSPEEKQRLLGMMEQRANRNRDRLDALPDTAGSIIKELRDYDFMDDEAREDFQKLLDTMQQQMLQNYFQDMKQQLQGMTPEDMQSINQMLRDLNEMLRENMLGQPPDIDRFMAKYGQMFGADPPKSLEELLEMIGRQMAQVQSLMNSMSPSMRKELQEVMRSLLTEETLDELDDLGDLMGQLFPMSDLYNQYPFMGQEDLTLEQAMDLMGQLQDMDELDNVLKDVMRNGNIDDVDLDKVQELMGEEARRAIEELKNATRVLEESGYIKRKGDKFELAPRGIRKIGEKALQEVFSQLKKSRFGEHEIHHRGLNGEDTGETKPYEFGDPFDVDLRRTLMNSIVRNGQQLPISLSQDDFEIRRREQVTQAATCLLLDQSRSMGMFGSFLAAKKVALALYTLTQSQFPRDKLWVIGFSDCAVELKGEELPEATWNAWVSGTNLQHALLMSRQFLAKQKAATKQIVVITDGEPTAHNEGSRTFFSYPPSIRTIQETLKEVKRCTDANITINTFMLENSPYLMQFIEQLTRINRGRAFYTNPDKLGEFVLVDYLSNRRKLLA